MNLQELPSFGAAVVRLGEDPAQPWHIARVLGFDVADGTALVMLRFGDLRTVSLSNVRLLVPPPTAEYWAAEDAVAKLLGVYAL